MGVPPACFTIGRAEDTPPRSISCLEIEPQQRASWGMDGSTARARPALLAAASVDGGLEIFDLPLRAPSGVLSGRMLRTPTVEAQSSEFHPLHLDLDPRASTRARANLLALAHVLACACHCFPGRLHTPWHSRILLTCMSPAWRCRAVRALAVTKLPGPLPGAAARALLSAGDDGSLHTWSLRDGKLCGASLGETHLREAITALLVRAEGLVDCVSRPAWLPWST